MAAKEQSALYRRWNPETLDDVCGNAIAKAKCQSLISGAPSKRPGFYLITGPTGTGKSTLAHILANEFGCGDVRVYNSRECGKIEFVTDFLTNQMPAASLLSAATAYIFEEAHNITVAAQEMFMEPLEKGVPANTYVFFVTNCPERLTGGKGALISRPFRIETVPPSPQEMIARLTEIRNGERLSLTDAEVAACAALSNRSVRTAVNNMARLASLPNELRERETAKSRLESEEASEEVPPNLRDLAVAVERGSWDGIAAVLRKMKENGDDPEGVRRGLLAWYSGTLLSDKAACRPKRRFSRDALAMLKDNYYSSGFPGLVCDLAHLAREGI